MQWRPEEGKKADPCGQHFLLRTQILANCQRGQARLLSRFTMGGSLRSFIRFYSPRRNLNTGVRVLEKQQKMFMLIGTGDEGCDIFDGRHGRALARIMWGIITEGFPGRN